VWHFYREAVATSSPTLPRFAATLGREGLTATSTAKRLRPSSQPRRNRVAVESLNGVLWTQRSREARQRWAGSRNRFAVDPLIFSNFKTNH